MCIATLAYKNTLFIQNNDWFEQWYRYAQNC